MGDPTLTPITPSPPSASQEIPWEKQPRKPELEKNDLLPSWRWGLGPRLGKDNGHSSYGIHLDGQLQRPELFLVAPKIKGFILPFIFQPAFQADIATQFQSAGIGFATHLLVPDFLSVYVKPMFNLNYRKDGTDSMDVKNRISGNVELLYGIQFLLSGKHNLVGYTEYGHNIYEFTIKEGNVGRSHGGSAGVRFVF